MNSLTVAGPLGRDAEVKYLANGDAICAFSVADSAGRDKGTIWWNCSIYGKRAESLAPYLTKGQSVTIVGTLTQRKWTDKEGQERVSMDLRVGEIALQGGRREEQEAPKPKPRQQEIPEDEDPIPF
jgi:single-strand DNA-binding protein